MDLQQWFKAAFKLLTLHLLCCAGKGQQYFLSHGSIKEWGSMFQIVWISLNEPSDLLLQKPPEPSQAIVCLQLGLRELGKDVWMLQWRTCTTLSKANLGVSQGPTPLPTTLQYVRVCV